MAKLSNRKSLVALFSQIFLPALLSCLSVSQSAAAPLYPNAIPAPSSQFSPFIRPVACDTKKQVACLAAQVACYKRTAPEQRHLCDDQVGACTDKAGCRN